MLSDEQLKELGRLACQRCEQATNSVGQLLENEEQAVELLINVINSMVNGCATLMQPNTIKDDGDEPSVQECVVQILAILAKANGIKEIRYGEKNQTKRKLS